MTKLRVFAPPHNYCDVQCERCVFERDCVIARELRNSRWLDETTLDQPVPPAVGSGDANGSCRWLDALDWSPSPKSGPVERPSGAGASFIERLRRAGVNYSLSLGQLLQKLSTGLSELFRDAEIATALVAPKVARLTMSLLPTDEPRFDPFLADDGYATLLLIEHIDARATTALSAVCTDRMAAAAGFRKSRAGLWKLLEPLRVQVPADARAELGRLIVTRAAPSPFFVVSN